jgi:hypothetical protein
VLVVVVGGAVVGGSVVVFVFRMVVFGLFFIGLFLFFCFFHFGSDFPGFLPFLPFFLNKNLCYRNSGEY